jgi:uncharacterized membrane protein (DUF2068 family)
MAKKKLENKERFGFALDKSLGAGKWIVLSGTATFFLTEILKMVQEIELPSWAILVIYLVVNTLLFAVSKYIEGQD